MKKACPYCGRIHDKNVECEYKPKYSGRKEAAKKEDKFRWSYDWKMKREHILKRDKYLCQACLHSLPGTERRLNNQELSVHHIQPLSTNYEKRLSDENLITLCRFHHEKAEKGEIPAQILSKILLKYAPPGVIFL